MGFERFSPNIIPSSPEGENAIETTSQHKPAEENEKQLEKLTQYAQEHYADYLSLDPEITNLLSTIRKNRELFNNEILPNIPLGVLEATLKAQSYNETVEQHKNEHIKCSGFDNDPDVADIKDFMYRAFGEEILAKCLISKIKYTPDKVNVRIRGAEYMLPVDVYATWKKDMPEVESYRFRAESFVLWNTDPVFSKKFIPTPIHLYSFSGIDPEKFEYLIQVHSDKKIRLYKLGTLAHEIAHHVYSYGVDSKKQKEWKELVDLSESLTDYAAEYATTEVKYDEFFAESVRLKTTVPDYLKSKFPAIDNFLTTNFPNIHG